MQKSKVFPWHWLSHQVQTVNETESKLGSEVSSGSSVANNFVILKLSTAALYVIKRRHTQQYFPARPLANSTSQ